MNTLISEQGMDSPEFYQLKGLNVSYQTIAYHEPNQDSLGVYADEENRHFLFIVADGMGGHSHGEKASSTLVKRIIDECKKSERKGTFMATEILDAIDKAHDKIQENWKNAGTTLTMVEICKNQCRFYSVGDSPAAFWDESGKIIHRPISHSPIGFLDQSGMNSLNEEEKKEVAHEVLNAIGFDDYFIEISPSIRLDKNDLIILASDGFIEEDMRAKEFISHDNFQEVTEKVIEQSLVSQQVLEEIGLQDDSTFILIQIR